MPNTKPTPDETLRNLIDSLDSDLLTGAVPIEKIEAELREAGCDPAELVARCRPKIEALLAARREAWRKEARRRLADRGLAVEVSQAYEGPADARERLQSILGNVASIGAENAVRLAFTLGREAAVDAVDRDVIHAIRRDIERRIQESIDDGRQEMAASLIAEWSSWCDVLRRIAPYSDEVGL